jgi:hypothetical protein
MPDPKKTALDKVQVKSHQIVDVLSSKLDARMECIKRIRDLWEDSYGRYYERHPQYAVDERGADATEWSLNGLNSLINILGDYVISFKDGVHPIPLSVQLEEHKDKPGEPAPVARSGEPIVPTGNPTVT